jgi:hypothetical protein
MIQTPTPPITNPVDSRKRNMHEIKVKFTNQQDPIETSFNSRSFLKPSRDFVPAYVGFYQTFRCFFQVLADNLIGFGSFIFNARDATASYQVELPLFRPQDHHLHKNANLFGWFRFECLPLSAEQQITIFGISSLREIPLRNRAIKKHSNIKSNQKRIL